MNQNTINAYQRNAILTASPAELTLMLYDGRLNSVTSQLWRLKKRIWKRRM